ncbi:MAG: hypothetical protein ABFD89_05820 [Bryobacteraceae bacterium]
MTQGVVLGVILAIIGYAVIRGLARLALAPWSAEWMDRRAMLARAESDALHAAQDQFARTVDAWRDSAAREVADAD